MVMGDWKSSWVIAKEKFKMCLENYMKKFKTFLSSCKWKLI